ncbi:Cadherin-related family member 5 [Channa argus]|uniref:Cadherin-related family member 5 n=1 Tax=Channa argus TaxID=215402 RepID=A0A6G1QVJ4_CHAAH|nr:Cadherin-related family member 5 [Channa argus]
MDEMNPHFTVRTSLSFLILTLLQTSGLAADMCSADSIVTIAENNAPGAIVTNITTEPGVTLEFSDAASTHDNTFRLEGNQLIAAKALDYESKEEYSVRITCSNPAIGPPLPITIVVIVNNVNDNPPVFSKSLEEMIVNEMSPVGTTVGRFTATDGDNDLLYYTLTSELDTPLTSTKSTASFTASTTIMVTIVDVDNRPPWFQPCTKYELGGALVCLSSSYTGRVVLNEKESGVLPLKPGPLYAIDGDSDINGEITYAFVSGNEDGLFEINPDTGNITMLKPADVLGTITLTVVAAQRINTFQFTSTTVTISVQVKSLHPPKFQSPQYEGIITAVGTMAMDMTNKDKPLQILAKDDDYIATEGFNPHISYSIEGRSDFIILDGFLFMTEDLPESTVPLKVVATDTSNEESSTARLSVVVKTGLTTTSLPLNTTDMTTSVGESTTDHSSNSSTTSDASSTTNPMVISPGGYGVVDMAALGATLGVLLFVCLVVIGVLIHRMRKGKADWRKMFEASMFQSSLGKGAGGHKEGIQYTNEAFENDEDGGSMGSSDPAGGGGMSGGEPRRVAADMPLKEATAKSSTSLHGLLPDDMSQAGSDASDEKEVKPILTKERRMEEGYKAVWFKEDIDPNAKEEVVIISDNREEDSEEDEQSFSGRDEDDEDNPKRKTSKVVIAEADLDSGLGVKIEDRGEDSDDDEVLNVDL